ncbi:MAG: sensor histidine kinase [Lachnospiraceae bacterium]|nr:sensor histidine kinase [Lachnospiraceae bacterium]
MGADKRQRKIKDFVIVAVGIVLILASAFFSYHTVKNTIVEREQESLRSIANVSTQSILASIQAKSNLIYAAFAGDMGSFDEMKQSLLKVEEKGNCIMLSEAETLEEWRKNVCDQAARSPGEVIEGPVRQVEAGYYVLYMTKAVYMEGSLAGYVQVELNLDEIYEEEQALSNLELGNLGYCLVKNSRGETIMPRTGSETKTQFSISGENENNCAIEWVYEAGQGTPMCTRNLVAYDKVSFGGEKFVLCIMESYDEVVKPIERIALYFCLLGGILLLWSLGFGYRMVHQQEEEEKLKMELQYEKELNAASEALKKQEQMMQQYNHSKTVGILTGAIAHEFNNLMTPIVLYTGLLEENDKVTAEMPEEVEELADTARRCEELARQLLEYSRQGRAEKVLSNYNVTFAVQMSAKMVTRLLPDSIIFQSQICKTPYYIRGQIGSMNQMILNLTMNAIHAMSSGGTFTLQFGLSKENERYVRLVVSDTGTGIAKEIQSHVFDPFFTTKQDGQGNGIGLTVVKRLVEEHGGNIRVATEAEKGTTFIIDIPLSTE